MRLGVLAHQVTKSAPEWHRAHTPLNALGERVEAFVVSRHPCMFEQVGEIDVLASTTERRTR
jgi:hypothetical protein